MKLFKSADLLHFELINLKKQGYSIGFVPTMGALHHGHLSLIQRAKAENVSVVASIFVNPKQFNDINDLKRYPKPIEKDMDMLIRAGVDYLFLPEERDIYYQDYLDIEIPLGGLDLILEGEQRPGHFQGVVKVVKRLFEIIKPNRAYFGQKDFQQTVVINHLVNQFFPELKIVVCPIIRESNGLAMSSRNAQLSHIEREKSSFIYKSLLKLKERSNFKSLDECLQTTAKYLSSIDGVTLEYLNAVNGDNLKLVNNLNDADYIVVVVVVKFGGVRLLDNVIIKSH